MNGVSRSLSLTDSVSWQGHFWIWSFCREKMWVSFQKVDILNFLKNHPTPLKCLLPQGSFLWLCMFLPINYKSWIQYFTSLTIVLQSRTDVLRLISYLPGRHWFPLTSCTLWKSSCRNLKYVGGVFFFSKLCYCSCKQHFPNFSFMMCSHFKDTPSSASR